MKDVLAIVILFAVLLAQLALFALSPLLAFAPVPRGKLDEEQGP